MQQISRIDAVNEILKVKSAERVASVGELDTIPQAVEAGNELDMAVIHIQTQFEWHYNSIENGQLTTDNDGNLTLPDNLSFIEIHSTTASIHAEYLRPVAGKLYDTYNHTFNLGVGKTVRYAGRLVWEYADLPSVFQLFAIAHARREVVGGGTAISPQRLAIEKQRYNDALAACLKFDNKLHGGRMRKYAPKRRRPPYNNGWV